MGDHARISPSAMDRIIACPASVALCDGMPDQSSVYAEEGTAAHEELEKCLKEGNDSNNEHVQMAVDYVWNRVRQDGMDVFYTEMKVYPKILQRDDCWGTADLTLHDFGLTELEIADFKYGAGVPVEAKDNKQLITYALGAVQKFVIDQRLSPPETVKMTIIQPRCPHPDGPVRSWTITFDKLMEIAEDMRSRLTLVDSPDAPFGPSDKACRWCKARAVCTKRSDERARPYIALQQVVCLRGCTSDDNVALLHRAFQAGCSRHSDAKLLGHLCGVALGLLCVGVEGKALLDRQHLCQRLELDATLVAATAYGSY